MDLKVCIEMFALLVIAQGPGIACFGVDADTDPAPHPAARNCGSNFSNRTRVKKIRRGLLDPNYCDPYPSHKPTTQQPICFTIWTAKLW